MADLTAFLVAAIALIASPGPATMSIAGTGAAYGVRAGFRYTAGLVCGFLVVLLLVASGVIGMILAVPGALPVLTALAAAYMLYLAWKIAAAPPLGATPEARARPRFLAGLGLALVNPKGYAAVAALLSRFTLIPDAVIWDAGLKIAILMGVVTVVDGGWLVAGRGLSRLFRSPRAARALNVSFALLLVFAVIAAVLF